MMKQKGITLIALIITIIVMIILVGVTVNVALNGGLFNTTKKAAYQTEVRTVQEQLEAEKVTKISENEGKIPSNYGITIDNLSISEELKNKYGSKLIISKDGTLYYNPAVVTDEEEQNWLEELGINAYSEESADEDLLLLEKYILGEDEHGRPLEDIFDMANQIFKDDPNTIQDASTSVEYLSGYLSEEVKENNLNFIFNLYIKYNNSGYFMTTDGQELITNKLSKVYEPKGYEGQDLGDVTGNDMYKGFTILYDNSSIDGTVEVIIPDVIEENFVLGFEDPTAQEVGDGDIVADDSVDDRMDKAIYSYNNAIKRLGDYCKSYLENNAEEVEMLGIVSMRSVGSNPIDPYAEEGLYYSDFLASSVNGVYNGIAKGSDLNFEQDLARMSYYNVLDIGKTYWLASRNIGYSLSHEILNSFGILQINGAGALTPAIFWEVGSERR